MLEITPERALVLGSLTTFFVFVLRQLAARQIFVPRWAVMALVVGVSLVLAVIWAQDTLPPAPTDANPLAWFAWLGEFLVALSPIIAFATMIYNFFAERLLDWLAVKVGFRPARQE